MKQTKLGQYISVVFLLCSEINLNITLTVGLQCVIDDV